MLGQTGRISNDSVSTTYVVPCDSWIACHRWWWDVYLRLIWYLSFTYAVSETATALRHPNPQMEEVSSDSGTSSSSSNDMEVLD